jgi:hypothetical protein
LLVGNPAGRGEPLALLGALGFVCEEADDPYTALLELFQRPLVFHAVVLSLPGLYREELQVVRAVKHYFPHIEVWLAQTDGRHAAMAEAICLGADGLLSEDGLHRTGISAAPQPGHFANEAAPLPDEAIVEAERESDAEPSTMEAESEGPHSNGEEHEDAVTVGEPVLSADELRALLQEQPFMPPRADGL